LLTSQCRRKNQLQRNKTSGPGARPSSSTSRRLSDRLQLEETGQTAGGRALLGLTLRAQTGVAPSSPRSRLQMVAVLLVLASLFAVATGQAGCPTQSKVRLVFCYASAFLLREPTRARRCLVPRAC
jgi:hypothetical protein